MEIPKLICDRDIAPNDSFDEMFDESQPVFSSVTVRDFLDAHQDATEIILEVRSDGGSTSEARIIYDMLKGCGKTITTHGYKVNSSAMILFLAGEQRLISQNSDSIIHPVWVDAFGLPWQLEAEDLRLFANEIEKEQVKLIDIYCSVIGEDNRVEVTQLMAQTTNLTCDESIRLGFATGKLGVAEKVENSNRSVVYTNKMFAAAMHNKKKEMVKEEKSVLDNVLNTINNITTAFKTKNETEEVPTENETVNASAELAEGGSVYFNGELSEGTAVFSDESMETPSADGEYALADGRSVVVAEGLVSEVMAASSEDDEEEVDEENKEVSELKDKVASLEASNATIIENQEKTTEALNKVTKLLGSMSNLVVGDNDKGKAPKREVPTVYAEMTNKQKMDFNRGK